MNIDSHSEPTKPAEIFREVITIRPTTTTREAIRITITQRQVGSEIALATVNISGTIPIYFEKPDLLDDLSDGLKIAAYLVRKQNRRVKDGK